MSNKLIVMVSDLDDASHGEINILDGAEQAAEFIETLLDSGFEQERIRIFGGDEMGMTVRHRPVVQLTVPGGAATTEARGRKEEATVASAKVAPQPEQEEESAAAPVVARASAEPEEAAAPGTRNGVRFSTQFRTA